MCVQLFRRLEPTQLDPSVAETSRVKGSYSLSALEQLGNGEFN